MKFLTEKEIGSTVRELLNGGSSLKAAVAFWGKGASKELGLMDHPEKVSVVCNLGMGGTNPNEIDKMRKSLKVTHRNDLHAKVYLFDNAVIIGSSNASANGLSYQDNDDFPWCEANVLIENQEFISQISQWFTKISNNSNAITESDIKNAHKYWKHKRGSNVIHGKDIITSAGLNPDQFEDRDIFVCVTTEEMSSAAEKTLKEVLPDINDVDGEINCYENWEDIPENALLIDFFASRKRTRSKAPVTYEGLWKTPEPRKSIPVKGSNDHSIQLCIRQNDVMGMDVGEERRWLEAVAELIEQPHFNWQEGVAMPLAEFARRYLRNS